MCASSQAALVTTITYVFQPVGKKSLHCSSTKLVPWTRINPLASLPVAEPLVVVSTEGLGPGSGARAGARVGAEVGTRAGARAGARSGAGTGARNGAWATASAEKTTSSRVCMLEGTVKTNKQSVGV